MVICSASVQDKERKSCLHSHQRTRHVNDIMTRLVHYVSTLVKCPPYLQHTQHLEISFHSTHLLRASSTHIAVVPRWAGSLEQQPLHLIAGMASSKQTDQLSPNGMMTIEQRAMYVPPPQSMRRLSLPLIFFPQLRNERHRIAAPTPASRAAEPRMA